MLMKCSFHFPGSGGGPIRDAVHFIRVPNPRFGPIRGGPLGQVIYVNGMYIIFCDQWGRPPFTSLANHGLDPHLNRYLGGLGVSNLCGWHVNAVMG